MIIPISPAIVAKANALGLTELYDINGDGSVNSEDINLCAEKQGLTIEDADLPTQPQVVKAVATETGVIA